MGPFSHDLPQPAALEWPNLRDPFEVTVDVNDPEPVVECGFGDEKVGNRRAVPHAVVVCQVSLQHESSVENVGRRLCARKRRAELGCQSVVRCRRPG